MFFEIRFKPLQHSLGFASCLCCLSVVRHRLEMAICAVDGLVSPQIRNGALFDLAIIPAVLADVMVGLPLHDLRSHECHG